MSKSTLCVICMNQEPYKRAFVLRFMGRKRYAYAPIYPVLRHEGGGEALLGAISSP